MAAIGLNLIAGELANRIHRLPERLNRELEARIAIRAWHGCASVAGNLR